jgi:hypothetical protein
MITEMPVTKQIQRSPVVSTTLPWYLFTQAYHLARAQDKTMSEWVRDLVREAVQREKGEGL